MIHQAIVTAKTRRLQDELMLHTDARDAWSFRLEALESQHLDKDAASFPQRPLVLCDKWDF
jgi:hypothetical protein